VLLFLSALRAVVEMVGLCAIGQGVLYVLAGSRRADNAIYRLFDLVTAPPRRLVRRLLPGGLGERASGPLSALLLFVLWIGLAWLKKSV